MKARSPWHRCSWAIVLLLGAMGCSSARPLLYPNEHYNTVGDAVAQRDIDECMTRARAFAKGGSQAEAKARDAAKSAGYGAVSGAAVGVVSGAIGGSAGEGAAVGAAAGATAGLVSSIFGGFFGPSGPDPVEAGFVDRCLREKGYDPIGWK